MADIAKLLAEAAGTVPTAQAPRAGVPLPSFEQAYSIAAGMETGKGTLSMSALEADLRNLSPNRLIEKYGEATALRLMGAQQRANTAYLGDLSLQSGRTPGQVAWDSATGVGSGFALGLGSLGALSLGLINDEAGAWASDKIQKGAQWVEGKQSSGV